ncbi:MAG: hypothetical protein H8E84_05250 [Flavobacteriales bacterium]|nr:hypothetical protein [Flavobacteriales bacterium]
MNTLAMIKRTEGCTDKDGIPRGWIIYYDKKDKIYEIKSLFQPQDYKGSRPVYTDRELIKILTKQS